ncbi:phosphoesterase [Fischerella sp. NIES-4106]|nr:phosphoesterase [Fischerella sp. NIES-4106]
MYNQIVRRVAIAKKNTPAKNASLFALVNAAMADAGILAWEQKYFHDFWRPVVGIREHDQSMRPEPTEADNNISDNCDPLWLPLGAPNTNSRKKNFTPNFPAYPSGHATFGAAALHMTRLFYKEVKVGDKNPDNLFNGLDFISEEFNGISTDNKGTVRPRHRRNFPKGLWQMIIENGRSRLYLGVHWIFDAFAVKEDGTPDLTRTDKDGNPFGGVPLGINIAEDIYQAGGGKGPKKSTVSPNS